VAEIIRRAAVSLVLVSCAMRVALLGTLHLLLAVAACDGTILVPSSDDPGSDTFDLDQMITRHFTEADDEILNPERGLYIGFNLKHGAFVRPENRSFATLAIALVNLKDYRDRPIAADFLARLRSGFAAARAEGVKVILRFTYNAEFGEDAPRDRILGHIEQLTPLLQENADVISVMQAGFIGAWGEWHRSTNGLDNDTDRAAILDAILTALPASRGVQVRTPMFKDAYLPGGPLTDHEAFSGLPQARIGHHNDCFLASHNDLSTFADPVSHWQGYVANDGRFTAIGGETCRLNSPRSDCASAIAEMETQRWSYLNAEYRLEVLAAWDAQGCGDEIRKRLGYRFALQRVSHSEVLPPGGQLDLELVLRNRGFAAPFNERPVELVLRNESSRWVARLDDVDARWWAPGQETKLALRLGVPADVAPGTYTLALRLPDAAASLAHDPRYAIRLANDDVWDAETGDNVLTRELVVDPAAPGPRSSSGPAFVRAD
jgi:hypothetical protein